MGSLTLQKTTTPSHMGTLGTLVQDNVSLLVKPLICIMSPWEIHAKAPALMSPASLTNYLLFVPGIIPLLLHMSVDVCPDAPWVSTVLVS